MPEWKLSWEADEVRSGARRVPGFAGHIPGLVHTMGQTYGNSSATVLSSDTGPAVKRAHDSCILRKRVDGYTTPGDPLFPFKLAIYRTAPVNDVTRSRVIPHYAGHKPGWKNAHGQTTGKYIVDAFSSFNSTIKSRKFHKTSRAPLTASEVLAQPAPPPPPPTVPLYPPEKSYIPGTTCYAPCIGQRFGAGFGALTRQAFVERVPKVPAPLNNPGDGKAIDFLSVPAGYSGLVPRSLPTLYAHPAERTRPLDRPYA